METRLCGHCGQPFTARTSPSRAERGKFCSRSCGNTVTSRKHGHTTKHSASRTYTAWVNMWRRCTDPTAPNFGRYGGRGVAVWPDWKTFAQFLSDMGECPDGMSLDRINGNYSYSPGNCRWAPTSVQARNKKSNVWITFRGETLCRQDWARRLGISSDTIKYRLSVGWPLERALMASGKERVQPSDV